MNLRVITVQGPDIGKSAEFSSEELVLIGRGTGCQLQVLDPSLSRQHCRIHATGGRIKVSDAGSSWGTFVNGERIDEREIRPGDDITIGETTLRVEVIATAEAATLAPPPAVEGAQTIPPRSMPRPQPPVVEQTPPEPTPEPVVEEKPTPGKQLKRGENVEVEHMPDLPRDVPLQQLAGWHFARYDIEEKVAESRTGVVYRALDTKKQRTVALKFLWPDFSFDKPQVQRFVRAMKTMLHLKHANLIALHGAGKNNDLCWVASEWVDGESVTELINRIGVTGMLDWRTAWKITYGVAQALECAHDQNIVHRNILPGNIMVREKDGEAKLGDLMLAKALDDTESDRITKAGDVVGNVSYMAPEQLAGNQPADHRMDIYSLGATTYALLTGRAPFESDSSMELLRLVLSTNPDPPTKYNLSIPPLFVDLVMRMLAKDPKDRYEYATTLITDLKRVAKFSGEAL